MMSYRGLQQYPVSPSKANMDTKLQNIFDNSVVFIYFENVDDYNTLDAFLIQIIFVNLQIKILSDYATIYNRTT